MKLAPARGAEPGTRNTAAEHYTREQNTYQSQAVIHR